MFAFIRAALAAATYKFVFEDEEEEEKSDEKEAPESGDAVEDA